MFQVTEKVQSGKLLNQLVVSCFQNNFIAKMKAQLPQRIVFLWLLVDVDVGLAQAQICKFLVSTYLCS